MYMYKGSTHAPSKRITNLLHRLPCIVWLARCLVWPQPKMKISRINYVFIFKSASTILLSHFLCSSREKYACGWIFWMPEAFAQRLSKQFVCWVFTVVDFTISIVGETGDAQGHALLSRSRWLYMRVRLVCLRRERLFSKKADKC